MKTGHRRQTIFCICLILLNLAFIFGNSLLPGKQSTELSDGILDLFVEFLDEAIPNGRVWIRKTAHFTEFACLGLLAGWLAQILNRRGVPKAALLLLFGVLIALTDETLQFLSPERSPGVLDVWIDVLGFSFGALLIFLGHCLRQKRKQSSNGGTET